MSPHVASMLPPAADSGKKSLENLDNRH